ncbi:MAG TPA: hypothetical protein EYN06_01075 [Myxococcales bacterium]|nr:hypothetical protein [Myxococcales bacterium]HIN85042.1 hypothetical protein [Myxococcales bacterium]
MNRGLNILFCLIISAGVLACGTAGGGSGSSVGNSCEFAFDGYCDEGQSCDFGTDCNDCGNCSSGFANNNSGQPSANSNSSEPHDPYSSARQPKDPYPSARQPKAPYPTSGTSDSSSQSNASTGNTCEFAFDGECDEGESCNFGTDCSDCGNCSGGGKAPIVIGPEPSKPSGTGEQCSTACSILSACDFVPFSTCLSDCSIVEPLSDCILELSGSCSDIANFCFGV